MRKTNERGPSIRRRLFTLLLIPAALVLAAGTATDYLASRSPLRDAYDQALIDAAIAIAAYVEPDAEGNATLTLSPHAIALLRSDSSDSIYFQVTGANARYIAGDAGLPQLHQNVINPARGDAVYGGERIRMVAYRAMSAAGPIVVTVAETMHKRDHTLNRILSSALLVDAAQLSLVLLLIWLGVRLAMVPLHHVERQIGSRSPRDLAALPTTAVPVEILSLVKTINRLFNVLRDTGSAQRRFLESAAHQLRTPLTGVQAQLELLAAEATEPNHERLDRVLDATRRLAHTTHQLLTLARSDEAANLNWDFTSVDLAQLVESIVTQRLATADLAGIDLGAQIEPVRARGVAWLLEEALGNLVNNAIAHTPNGGSVTVQCGREHGAVFLEVIDTGIGIPPAERQHVLERFFRASNARGTGTGLGLAIVDEVAQLHGAGLAINSGPDGRGTAIRLTFPPEITTSG
ncbi:sensor histidine kinase [Steroidobacter flavus]|uniref:histidine kinase n=1 Tax=Steroidobacter flavus TaxID=1842136 RepID=A0ABV8T3G6_9GAMM